jgi:hemoglobin-like flavoprotein
LQPFRLPLARTARKTWDTVGPAASAAVARLFGVEPGRSSRTGSCRRSVIAGALIQLVSWRKCNVDCARDRLFAISPNLRELFPADLRAQKGKLMQMIATTVGALNNLNQLVPAVKALGARHSTYGVTIEHYRLVGEALLWTLERGLGQDFTPEVRSAWAKVYHVLAATMQAGAAQVANVQAAE